MTEREYPYGFCPTCGYPGKERERRLNGNDTCIKGHTYPSASAKEFGNLVAATAPETTEDKLKARIAELEEALRGMIAHSCVADTPAEDKFSRIKFRLYNKDVRQTQVMTLAKLIATTFRRSKFEYRGVFTGLKDRNGKEIWEGDVVSVANAVELPDGRFEDAIHTVTFVEGGFRLPDHSAPDIKIAHDLGETVELEKVFVIGNIYENPDLLEEA